ncbi:MAG: hypothetical protein RLZZ500_2612 [Bacteroidota bacterium]
MRKFVFLFVFPMFVWGQNDTLKIEWGGFIDTYYSYDTAAPNGEQKLPFFYNYNRHNEFAVNLALLKAKVNYQNMYASVAVQAGTYVEDNYANESVKYLNEAYVGVYLDAQQKHSLEMGILPSYIGFESATTLNNLTLTRSLLADNSPYFMTGVWYHYNPNARWSLGALVTNGWQRIHKADRSVEPALGTQITYKPSSKHTFNWSSYAGKEQYATFTGMRWFENLYWEAQWNTKWHTLSGVDIGFQHTPSGYKTWWTPVIITQYTWNTHWQTALRGEYYSDKNQVMIAFGQPFAVWGTSLNMDYCVNKFCKFRVEGRYLSATENILNGQSNSMFLTTSLVMGF